MTSCARNARLPGEKGRCKWTCRKPLGTVATCNATTSRLQTTESTWVSATRPIAFLELSGSVQYGQTSAGPGRFLTSALLLTGGTPKSRRGTAIRAFGSVPLSLVLPRQPAQPVVPPGDLAPAAWAIAPSTSASDRQPWGLQAPVSGRSGLRDMRRVPTLRSSTASLVGQPQPLTNDRARRAGSLRGSMSPWTPVDPGLHLPSACFSAYSASRRKVSAACSAWTQRA